MKKRIKKGVDIVGREYVLEFIYYENDEEFNELWNKGGWDFWNMWDNEKRILGREVNVF